ncbi:MAG: Acid phosphatase [Verrucomicrobiota bacterium]|nr:Acid phosphatase [Verrucomicrobiota bacterium]
MLKLKRLPALLVVLAILALPASQFAAEPANLSPAKEAVVRYVNSGEYGRELTRVAVRANKYLAKRLARPLKEGEKRAIVLDIDETTLTNLGHMMAQDFGYLPEVWDKWVASGQAKPIVPVQLIYDVAVRNNVAVFFVTSRGPEEAASTERNLRETGYPVWSGIHYKPAPDMSARQFKTGIRRRLLDQGYTIILNIGDQQSDLVGGMAERAYKLPNPFYLIR